MIDGALEVTYRIEFETGDTMHTKDRKLAELHHKKGRFITPPLTEQPSKENPVPAPD
ncbi:hypothetical protein LFL96_21285 [Paraburkholderia sp. D15]|uniref:hypothetical protein n=1 Tax=Paraburkholderia sp. D15 TaxID=2880218 RepID=UPI002479CF5A|nr:hypothetical protein [Paraburkholderia sp. D15]WGS53594.1 hypothetical protein LFL96_21285 [Paraburkholderia sp. D15]